LASSLGRWLPRAIVGGLRERLVAARSLLGASAVGRNRRNGHRTKLPLGVGSPPTLTPALCLSLRPLFSFPVGYLAELSRGAISFVALVAERLETLTAFGDEGVSISALAVRVHT
jgi:hypothetical protein